MSASTAARPVPVRRLVATGAALAVVAVLLIAPAPDVASAATSKRIPDPWASEGLAVLGELPNPWQEAANGKKPYGAIQYVDEETRLGYGLLPFWTGPDGRLGVYDLRTPIPTPVRVSEAPVSQSAGGNYIMTIDRVRNRMLIAGRAPTSDNRSMIDVIDLKSLERVASWDLSTAAPGYVAMGARYDKASDRLLLLGEFTGNVNISGVLTAGGTRAVGPGPAVLALDAESGGLIWAAPMRQCHSVLFHSAIGSLLARSIHRPALYVFCSAGDSASQQVGQNAVLRLDISAQKSARGVVQLPTEVFPISGDYTGRAPGLVGFDPRSERLFAQSLAERTPGAWVFDGLRNSWVGFIAAPDNSNRGLGVNPGNGRHYQAGSSPAHFNKNAGYINVADGRATPVPQGTLFSGVYNGTKVLQEGIAFNDQILTDPGSNRLFALVTLPDPDGIPRNATLVLRDSTPSIDPLTDIDYDAMTSDLPDSTAEVQYSAAASGFGARYIMVGGWESAYDRIQMPFYENLENPAGPNPADLSYGDRGTSYSAVPAVDIRSAGASATAAGAGADQATASDRSDAEEQAGGRPDAPVTVLEGGLTCLDGAGERSEQTQGSGDPQRVSVVCDLTKATAEGTAAFSDDINGGGQSLGASSFTTRTFRDPERGVVTETVAVARGFSVRDPAGAGKLSIDRITTIATTVANGRPGTATASWLRRIEGAVVTDGDGAEQKPQTCATTVAAGVEEQHEGDCDELQRTINGSLTGLQLRFPTPEVTATPRGAYSRVEKRERDYLNGLTTSNDQSHAVPGMELVLFNDGPEKGRLLVQLAAIDANSIFTRSSQPLFPDFGDAGTNITSGGTSGNDAGSGGPAESTTTGATGGTTDGGGLGTSGGADIGTAAGGGDLAPSVAVGAGGVPLPAGGAAGSPVLGWMIGARGPRDAALAIGIWLLFAGALVGAWRRRRLIETVGS